MENSDSIESIHCYTADENRKIALLIKEGMEYRELYDVCEAQIKLMREQENLYRNVAENLEKAQVKADSAVVRLKTEHYEVMQANEKLKKKNGTVTRVAGISIGANVVLLLILIL